MVLVELLTQLWREKEISTHFVSLFISYEINYGLHKENKFNELIASIVFNDSFWVKLHILDLLMKYKKWGEYWLKNSENWALQLKVMLFGTNMYLSWPHTYIIHCKVCQRCYQGNLVYFNVILNETTPQWPWNCIVNLSQKGAKHLSSICEHQSLFNFIFNFSHYGLFYFYLLYNISG